MASLLNFPARSAWSLPPGFQRLAPVSPSKVALLGFEWVCAMVVFTSVSEQRAGLWGPSFADCAACNGTTECTTGAGGPHGLGCGYLAFGQFQLICAVGIMWWIGTSVILALAFFGRSPPPMTEFLIYVIFTLLVWGSTLAAFATCEGQPVGPGVRVCHGASSAMTACWFSLFLSCALSASCYWSFQTWRTLQFEGVPPPVTAAIGKIRVVSIALADQAGGPLRSVMAGVAKREGDSQAPLTSQSGGRGGPSAGQQVAAPARADEHMLPPGPGWVGSSADEARSYQNQKL